MQDHRKLPTDLGFKVVSYIISDGNKDHNFEGAAILFNPRTDKLRFQWWADGAYLGGAIEIPLQKIIQECGLDKHMDL